jgi:tetratricopeptide (TPR) repeat protein
MADSRFCRSCGAPIVQAIDRTTAEEDAKMVHDAQRLFGEARYDEALMVATAILDNDPFCVTALAIKGDCHERLGEYAQALGCYRDILTVEPDSQLDRIRVARLERIVSSGEIEIGQPNSRRRTALGAALAAAVLLVSSGSALILAAQNSSGESAAQTIDVDDAKSQPFYPVPLVPNGNTGYTPNNQAAPQDRDLDSLEAAANGAGINPLTRPGDTQRIAPGALRDVPRGQYDPVATNRVDPETVEPLRPNFGAGAGTPRTSPTGDPDPKVLSGTTGGDGGRNSIVEVRPSKNNDPATGNTQVEDRAIRINSLVQVAREQQVLGNYAKAADAYEKALELGASPASTNQRLAQCYVKLNKKAEAIRAYERAISAFEKLDQNDVRVQTQLDACRAELKSLRGS